MYIVTARIRTFWWMAIYYILAILIQQREMGIMTGHLLAKHMPPAFDLWINVAAGLFVFGCSVAVYLKTKFSLPLKALFLAVGVFVIDGSAFALFLALSSNLVISAIGFLIFIVISFIGLLTAIFLSLRKR